MSQTFLFTINDFRELKRLRRLVWLIIHDYFRHEVTTSTLDILSRTMAILLLLVWLLLQLLQLVTWFEGKTNFFLFGTRHFHCLTKTTKKLFADYKQLPQLLYRVPLMCYGEKLHAFLKTRLVGTGALLF